MAARARNGMEHTDCHNRGDSIESRELRGRTAVVTGAARGIGKAIALELAAAGADVLVHTGADREAGQKVMDSIRHGQRAAELCVADLADDTALRQFFESAWNWKEGVDIWVNNAGADVLTGRAAHWSFERKLEHLWRVDVQGTIRLSRFVGEKMKQCGRRPGDCAILNMGWDQAEQGMAGDSGELFAAIKGAVMAFTRSLAQSLAPEVRVNCLAPGWIKTSWGTEASDYWQQRACHESLSGRWGTPEDVARVARFLVSPAAEFVTGQVVPVNGGFRFG